MCSEWWKTNRILPVAFTGCTIDCEGRWLEIHLCEQGLWGTSLLARGGRWPKHTYAPAIDPSETEGAARISAHLASSVRGLPFEEMPGRIKQLMHEAQHTEVTYNKFHPDHPQNPNRGFWGLIEWKTPRPFFSCKQFDYGGLKFTLPSHQFIPILLERFYLVGG